MFDNGAKLYFFNKLLIFSSFHKIYNINPNSFTDIFLIISILNVYKLKLMKKKIAIIGGGIIGLAIAYKLNLFKSNIKTILFEKESSIGQHQSGRNSGVLHCGLSYSPGSLKANLAISGIRQMIAFCEKNSINHDICGKIVVANNQNQLDYIDKLALQGEKNGLKNLKFLNQLELKQREPYVRAEKALLVPEEGIVDYSEVMLKLSNLIKSNDGEILLNTKIEKCFNKGAKIVLSNLKQDWEFDLIINCTGLHTDRVYNKLTFKKSPVKIIPFRGEYLKLNDESKKLVNHLIYPVPDPKYPFLGVHFTRLVNGDRELGPNAVLAFKREGYHNTDFSLNDTIDYLKYIGFYKFLFINLNFSLKEFSSSIFMNVFIKQAKLIVPEIDTSMCVKGNSGVRAQSINPNGELMMDFKIIKDLNQIHLLNAPSPGATASLAIADYLIDNFVIN